MPHTLDIIRNFRAYEKIPKIFCELKRLNFNQFRSLQDDEDGMPDFEITLGEEKIGFEITEIFQDRKGKRETLLYQILNQARSLYQKRNGKPIKLTVHFIDPLNIRGGYERKTEIASHIVELLLQNSPDLSKLNEFDFSSSDNEYPEILYLKTEPTEGDRVPTWHPSDTSGQQELTTNIIRDNILKKNKKISLYKRRYSTNWLLLSTNMLMPSQLFKIDSSVIEAAYPSKFDATFLLSCADKKLWKLERSHEI